MKNVAAWRAVVAAAAIVVAFPALAQTRPPTAATPQPPAEPSAPYEPELLRLSEIMGSLAFLRDLCGDQDGDKWRARMAGLIDAEAGSQARKERLAGAYNRGFRSFATIYRTCTPNARALIDRYLDEGGKIAHDVETRFGGG